MVRFISTASSDNIHTVVPLICMASRITLLAITDFVQIIAALYSTNTSCVRVNGKLSSWFEVNIGAQQGCVLLHYLIYMSTT